MKALGRFGVASLASLGLIGGLAVAVVSSWHPVRPRVLCTMPLGNGETAVYFGYTNELDEPYSEPLSSRNSLSSWAKTQALPVNFAPGSSGAYPDAAFVATYLPSAQPAGEALEWRLGPRVAQVNESTPRCDITPPPEPPKDVVWVKPEPVAQVLPPEPPPEVIEAPPEPEPPPPEPPKPEPPKPQPKPETPPPKKIERRPPQPKPPQEAKPPEPAKPDAPVALSIAGLSNVGQGGMAIQSGENDSLGRADVPATRENTAPRVGNTDGVDDGKGDGPARKVARVPAKVKSRPKGEWPADAPPRAGAVLVRLSLLVGTDGRVKDVKIVRKAGGAFDREARLVGMKATFSPATVDGVPVESWVPWDVEFTPETW